MAGPSWPALAAKLLQAVACPRRCKDCFGCLAAPLTPATQPAPPTPRPDAENRYLLAGAPPLDAASGPLSGPRNDHGSRAMQDVVETVFSKVFSKKHDEDSYSSAPESAADTDDALGSDSTRVTHLPRNTANGPLSPCGNASDSSDCNDSNDSVFDDSLCGPQIVRPVAMHN